MVLLTLTFLLVLTYLYDTKVFVSALIVFFVLFDMLDGFYEDEKIFAAMRYIIPMTLMMVIILKEGAFRKTDFIFLLLSFYLVMLLVYSSKDIIVSAKNLLAVFITLLMIPLGRYLSKHINFVEYFEPFNRFLLTAIPVYIVIANKFGIGESYSEAFTTGFLITSRMYIVPIVTFLAIHYLVINRTHGVFIKLLDSALILVNICIIIINTRRTALGMLFIALIVYASLNRKLIFKMVAISVVFILALIASYPLYEKALTAQLEKRERIQDLDTYEEEGRYLETLYIMDYHAKNQNIFEILFGIRLFDTYDFGTKYFGRDRPIHSDLNMIFFSTGFVGLLLFSAFFFHYFLVSNRKIMAANKKLYYPLLVMFLIVLIPGRFIGTLTYAPFLMLLLSTAKFEPEQDDIIVSELEMEDAIVASEGL